MARIHLVRLQWKKITMDGLISWILTKTAWFYHDIMKTLCDVALYSCKFCTKILESLHDISQISCNITWGPNNVVQCLYKCPTTSYEAITKVLYDLSSVYKRWAWPLALTLLSSGFPWESNPRSDCRIQQQPRNQPRCLPPWSQTRNQSRS